VIVTFIHSLCTSVVAESCELSWLSDVVVISVLLLCWRRVDVINDVTVHVATVLRDSRRVTAAAAAAAALTVAN